MVKFVKNAIAALLALIGIVIVGVSWWFLYTSSVFGQALALMLVVVGAVYLSILLITKAYTSIEDDV